MRKLSLLIALCTLLTIGGVYATWTYTDEVIAPGTEIYSLNLDTIAESGHDGTFAITGNNLSFTINPAEDTTHVTALYIEGTITITFTPNEFTNDDIKKYGPNAEFFFNLSNANWTYVERDGAEAKPVVELIKATPNATHKILPTNSVEEGAKWSKDNNTGIFSYTISTDMLEEHVQLTPFLLDTRTDYYNYQAALSNGTVILTVQAVAPVQNVGN